MGDDDRRRIFLIVSHAAYAASLARDRRGSAFLLWGEAFGEFITSAQYR